MKEHITCIYTHGNIVQNFSSLCFIFSIETINAKVTAGALSKHDSVHGKPYTIAIIVEKCYNIEDQYKL